MTNPDKETGLCAGAARIDITPEPGIQLAGDIGRHRPTEEIRDRLYASALVLESDGRRICILSLDLLGSTVEWADRIREGAAARFGFDRKAIMVHAVQNHASPALGHFFVKDTCALMPPEYPWLRGGDDRYNLPTVDKCLEAIGEALNRLEPVTMRVGRGIDGRVAFNRRYVLRDGSSRMGGPAGDPQILRVEGPADPEVGVITLTNGQGRVVSALLHFTSHPCHGYPHRYVIGDWPGDWAERMHNHFGPSCVPLVINGCCGNVIHANSLDPDFRSEYHEMAGKLTETTLRVLDRMEIQDAAQLALERAILRLPLRTLDDERVTEAQALIEKHPAPIWLDEEETRVSWDWVYAVATLDLKDTIDRDPCCDYEIQALRIGDLALVGLMGEPFVEGQLRIKEESPAPYTFVAHFCNGFAGYVPTAEALHRGGYETRTANWSKFSPEALENIIDGTLELLNRLF